MSKQESTVIPIHLRYGAAFLIKGRGAVLVDCGNPGESELILHTLSRHGVKPDQLSLLLVTHGHLDHYGSARELKESTGVKVAVHRLDANAVRRGANAPLCATGIGGRVAQFVVDRDGGVPEIALEPDLLLHGETSLVPYGVCGRVIETPGHTSGSVSVLLPGGEAIVGDLLVGRLFRRRIYDQLLSIDKGKIRRSIRKVLDAGAKKIFASHGGPYKAEAVERILARSESK